MILIQQYVTVTFRPALGRITISSKPRQKRSRKIKASTPSPEARLRTARLALGESQPACPAGRRFFDFVSIGDFFQPIYSESSPLSN